MCYESLIDGDATEKPARELIREELSSALKDGTVAALVVVAVLFANGTSPALLAGGAVGALVLGVAVHQLVLLAGFVVVRVRASLTGRPTPDAA